jgi:molecular chaperone GrpE
MNTSDIAQSLDADSSKNVDSSKSENNALTACQEELNSWKDRCLRITADFDNFKKRTEREKSSWIKMTQANILHDLLVIVDDFERAVEEAKKNPSHEDFSVWFQGFELTNKSLQKLLQKYDVQEIKDHDIFNPQYHEAVMQVDSSDHISGSIVAVLQKGYLFKGEVLRPAKVSVAK